MSLKFQRDLLHAGYGDWLVPKLGTCQFGPMRVIARNVLIGFSERHPDAKTALDRWYRFVRAAYASDELGHTQAELAELLGSRSRASEVLSRRRALTVDMIHKIGEAWKIPANPLVQPYKLERAA